MIEDEKMSLGIRDFSYLLHFMHAAVTKCGKSIFQNVKHGGDSFIWRRMIYTGL